MRCAPNIEAVPAYDVGVDLLGATLDLRMQQRGFWCSKAGAKQARAGCLK